MKRYMLFDVGGTGVKYTTVDKNGEMVFPTKSFLSPSQKSAEEVFLLKMSSKQIKISLVLVWHGQAPLIIKTESV